MVCRTIQVNRVHMEVILSPQPSIVRHSVVPHPGISPVEVRLPRVAQSPGSHGSNGHARSGKPLSPDQIVIATAECFAEYGYDGTTIRVIAARLGCAVGSIYRHFDDKRSLLTAVAERALRPALLAIEHGSSVEVSVQRYVDSATEHGELYRMMFWLAAEPDAARLPGIVERLMEHWAQALGDRSEAMQRWAEAHSRILLGDRLASVTVQLTEEQAAPPVAVEPEREEDVTLL